MTDKDWNEQETIEGKELMKEISNLLDGKSDELVVNTLLCLLINASVQLEVASISVVLALANGFEIANSKKKFRPEILN